MYYNNVDFEAVSFPFRMDFADQIFAKLRLLTFATVTSQTSAGSRLTKLRYLAKLQSSQVSKSSLQIVRDTNMTQIALERS